MFLLDLLQLSLSSMESNATILRRRPRHISFMDIRNSTRCHFSEKTNTNITDMCDFVTHTLSCHYFMANIDYLKIIFCYFKIPLDGIVVFMGCLMMLILYGLIYMLTKYFFLPNFEMLMDLVPISSYTFGYAGFGLFFFMPEYLETGLTCLFQNSYEATLRLSGFFGDLMRYFVLGICTLCVNGYKVRGLTLWSSILFLLMGYFYLIIVVLRKYEIFQQQNLINDDLYTLKFSAVSILIIFILYMMANVLISYNKTKKERKQMGLDLKRMTSTNLVKESSEWKWWQIWWSTVNGYETMKEPIVGVVTVLLI
ncbi:mitochondrial sodium/calcium exchanger protein isoform X2 [Drosophila willistoni]|uniref:mitochondrial sodium/calcium exchanger protein isoform X2 n=1 Tax=Drosophila willistoni TaxID=7260 RepID=UPI001F0740B2|nr:mitochondrial sodium/calcium exchanger protein isoform X2 [Drosophila willistoni]